MPPSREHILQSADKFAAKGKLDQALKEYLRILDDNPKDISTLNKVGDLYVRMNRAADSIPFFTRIADFYARDGFFLKAIAIYKKINKIDPSRLEVYERLADLYHKQGLTQDARSQYQVLADHYQKNSKVDDAIGVYRKMAAVDPNDLKIQVRLADLYRTAKQTDQAVMQYGLIGSMLLRRGANEEAAAVFQKALELSPTDAGIQSSLVRSLLAQRNPAAAVSILRAAPRTADSLALLAEAELEMGGRAEAARTAEQALALDGRHEGARQLLGKLKLAGGSIDGALNALGPLVDGAIAARDFARAAGYLEPLLEADSAHIPTIRKLAEVREAEGNAADAAELRLVLARDAEQHNDTDGAIAEYRRVLKAAPAHAQAMTRMAELAPGELSGTPPPSAAPAAAAEGAFEVQEVVVDVNPADERPVHAPQPVVPSMEFDAPPAATAAAEPDEAPPAPAPAGEATLSDREIETLVVESEVFARYGLTDKAVERLRSLTRRRPDLLKARERLVELMAETKNAALSQEAAALAEAWRAAGRVGEADLLLARHGLAPVTSSFPPPAASTPVSASDFEEFDIDIPTAPPAPPTFPSMEADEEEEPAAEVGEGSGEMPADVSQPDVFFPEAPNETIRLSTSEIAAAAAEAAAMAERSAPKPAAPIEGDFVSYEELGSLLQDEMQKAGAEKPAVAPPPPVIDEQNLFADERQFFNLAEELEKELADEVAPRAPDVGPQEGDVSLEEIFREFKKGVEQQLSAEDYETHFNLGIAYKEMGLTDEAIGEFQLASKDPKRAVECCSMLGLCFLEKGMPQLAVKWYRKGLEAPGVTEAETVGLLYDLGCVYQSTGDTDLAYRTFLEVYGLNTNYRDVSQRVKELETVRKE